MSPPQHLAVAASSHYSVLACPAYWAAQIDHSNHCQHYLAVGVECLQKGYAAAQNPHVDPCIRYSAVLPGLVDR